MVIRMKTTLVIDDRVLAKLRRQAARDDTTISALVEAALRLFLERTERATGAPPPLPSVRLGAPHVDVADRDALYRVMEEGDG